MLPSSDQSPVPAKGDIYKLQKEIALLQEDYREAKGKLEDFERVIHSRLDREIRRLHELNSLYKKHKQDKKLKRLEQKKKGKNYKDSTQIKPLNQTQASKSNPDAAEQKELRRLYKEAIVQVHPDKIHHAGEANHIHRATHLTAKLNEIYKSGDLEELLNFYQYIIIGNNSDDLKIQMPEVDGKLRISHLIKKKETLEKQIAELKDSYTYGILISYDNPLTFIDELYIQLHERIKLMEKRTKKAK